MENGLDLELSKMIDEEREKATKNLKKNVELKGFYLPIKIQNDSEYETELSKILNSYLENIKDRRLVDEEVFESTNDNIEKIKRALKYSYEPNISEAKQLIGDILEKYQKDDFIISKLDCSPAFRGETIYTCPKLAGAKLSFYKARVGKGEFSKEDFLHIPFNKRGYISTQRFSIAGVPAMYFGLTSYVCWLELGKPSDQDFNVASYKIPDTTRVLNLAISQMLINGLSSGVSYDYMDKDIEKRRVQTLIEFFPLVIATSFKVTEENRSFRSEYVISQLIMQCLSELGIEGVAYISKQIVKDSYNYFPYCVNLAIPMKNDSEVYSKFAKELSLTNPVNLSEYKKIKRKPPTREASYTNLWDNTQIKFAGKSMEYSNIESSEIDDYLFNEEFGTVEMKSEKL